MDSGNRNHPAGWVAQIPPRRWWRVGAAVGFGTLAILSFLVDVGLAWVARWPRDRPGETHR